MSSDQSTQPIELKKYSGFHTKSLEQRREILQSTDAESVSALNGVFAFDHADKMIENCVGTLAIPVGVCPYLVLNNKHFVVPMATEEPSVIAACSNITKLVAENGGFNATTTGNNMITQVQVRFTTPTAVETEEEIEFSQKYDAALSLAHQTLADLLGDKKALIAQANEFCPRMVARGGGVYDCSLRVVEPQPIHNYGPPSLDLYCSEQKLFNTRPITEINAVNNGTDFLPYLIIYFKVNVCDAMGANVVNTIAEGVAPKVIDRVDQFIQTNPQPVQFVPVVGLRILSNLCIDRITTSRFEIPIDKLTWKGFPGLHVAQGMLHALQLANDDVFRAVTHNKGVMNGITAVALATGQDTRAVEASFHAYASAKSGQYKPVTKYSIDMDKQVFVGEISIPIAVGTKGGALGQHPLFSWALKQLQWPDSQTLAQILASIGLAQNFAAMRALAVEGIQSGHMRLHARKTETVDPAPPALEAKI